MNSKCISKHPTSGVPLLCWACRQHNSAGTLSSCPAVLPQVLLFAGDTLWGEEVSVSRWEAVGPQGWCLLHFPKTGREKVQPLPEPCLWTNTSSVVNTAEKGKVVSFFRLLKSFPPSPSGEDSVDRLGQAFNLGRLCFCCPCLRTVIGCQLTVPHPISKAISFDCVGRSLWNYFLIFIWNPLIMVI